MRLTIFMFVLLCLIFCTLMDARAADETIASMATRFVGADAAAVVEAACCQIGAEESIDPWLIASVWRFEHGFKTSRGSGYYTGPMQLSPHHLGHMVEYGFDRTSWKDQIRYTAHLWRLSADKHHSLYSTLQPWGVRRKAMRLYHHIRGTYDHWACYPVQETALHVFESVITAATVCYTVQNLP